MDKSNFPNSNAIHETFRFYRQSGLGLSATIITLSSLLLKEGFDKSLILPWVWSPFLTLSIFSSILIQYFHYLGYQKFARTLIPNLSDETKNKKNNRKKDPNRYFIYGDNTVKISVFFFFFGFLIELIIFLGPKALLDFLP